MKYPAKRVLNKSSTSHEKQSKSPGSKNIQTSKNKKIDTDTKRLGLEGRPSKAPAKTLPLAPASAPVSPKEEGFLDSLFNFKQFGIFTSIAGYSHASYSQYTQGSHHIYKKLIAIFYYFNLEFYLFAGSMVGYVRNRAMPKWMDDLDILIFEDQIELFEEKIVPYLKECGFNCFTPASMPQAGYHVLALQQGDQRDLTIPLAEGIDVTVPWAQIDVFFTKVDEKGIIRNLQGWGLYHVKDIPEDWVRPGLMVNIENCPFRVFSNYKEDIARQYGDVMNNVVVHTHEKTFLTLPNTRWEDVNNEFLRIIAETAQAVPPDVTDAQVTAHRPNPSCKIQTLPNDSFNAIVAAIVRSQAGAVILTGGDQSFWVIDLKRLFPSVALTVEIMTSYEASRAAHLRDYIDSVSSGSTELLAQSEGHLAALRRVIG